MTKKNSNFLKLSLSALLCMMSVSAAMADQVTLTDVYPTAGQAFDYVYNSEIIVQFKGSVDATGPLTVSYTSKATNEVVKTTLDFEDYVGGVNYNYMGDAQINIKINHPIEKIVSGNAPTVVADAFFESVILKEADTSKGVTIALENVKGVGGDINVAGNISGLTYENNTITLFYTVDTPPNIVSETWPSVFYKSWEKNDPSGIATIVFDKPIKSVNEVSVTMGQTNFSSEGGEEVPPTVDLNTSQYNVVNIDGNTLTLNFTDIDFQHALYTPGSGTSLNAYHTLTVLVTDIQGLNGLPYKPQAAPGLYKYISFVNEPSPNQGPFPGDDDPNNPDNPDDPNNPDNPDDPDDPNNPDNPDDPNNPDNPDNPDEPGIPSDAELTGVYPEAGKAFDYINNFEISVSFTDIVKVNGPVYVNYTSKQTGEIVSTQLENYYLAEFTEIPRFDIIINKPVQDIIDGESKVVAPAFFDQILEFAEISKGFSIDIQGVFCDGRQVIELGEEVPGVTVKDGIFTISYDIEMAPAIVEQNWPETFYNYWPEGSPEGIAVITFDQPIKSVYAVTLNMGTKTWGANSGGDDPDPYIAINNYSVEGNNVIIDFTGIDFETAMAGFSMSLSDYSDVTVFVQGIEGKNGLLYSNGDVPVLTHYALFVNEPLGGKEDPDIISDVELTGVYPEAGNAFDYVNNYEVSLLFSDIVNVEGPVYVNYTSKTSGETVSTQLDDIYLKNFVEIPRFDVLINTPIQDFVGDKLEVVAPPFFSQILENADINKGFSIEINGVYSEGLLVTEISEEMPGVTVEDGVFTIYYNIELAPAIVNEIWPETFYNFWPEGEEAGMAVITFDQPIEDVYAVTLNMGYKTWGSAAGGDEPDPFMDITNIIIEGNEVIIDFTGINFTNALSSFTTPLSDFSEVTVFVQGIEGVNGMTYTNESYAVLTHHADFIDKAYGDDDDDPENPDGPTVGINGITADNGQYKVFSAQGRIILNTANAADLSRLTPGLYIINGKKIIIR